MAILRHLTSYLAMELESDRDESEHIYLRRARCRFRLSCTRVPSQNECQRDWNKGEPEAKASGQVSPREPLNSYPQKASSKNEQDKPHSRIVRILMR